MKKSTFLFVLLAVVLSCSTGEKIDERVILKAGELEFTMHDLNMHLTRFSFKDPADEFYKKQDFLEQHLDKMLIADAGMDRGLYDSVEVDSAQVARILTDIVYTREITDKLKITDPDLEEFWKIYGGEVQVSQILVDSQKLADSLYQVLLSAPDKFADIARAFSRDSITNQKGGDMGYVRVGILLNEIQEAAFRMKAGEISKPLKTPYGWHIVQVTDRKNYSREDFEENKSQYRVMYSLSQRQKLLGEFADKAKRKFNYVFYDKTWQMLVARATELKKSFFDQSRKLSAYIPPENLSEEESQMPIVSFEGFTYTAGEYVSEMKRYFFNQDFDLDYREIAENTVDELISSRLMYIYGLRNNLMNDPEFKRQYRDTKLGFVYRRMQDLLVDTLMVPEEEIQEYYQTNKKTFYTAPQVKISEILLATEAEAWDVMRRLKRGEPFSELVKLTIRPGFAETGGNLGYCNPNRYKPLYDEAIDLKAGDYSGPIKFDNNWAVILVTDKKPEHQKTLDEARTEIASRLSGTKKYKMLQQWLEERKQKINHYIDLEFVKNNLVTGKLEDES
jgi:parvulin-like peptidyl-prolyl isomerase